MSLKFEDLKELKYGDQITMEDPLVGGATPYALMSNHDDSYYFIGGPGASLVIKEQATIDGFQVKKIDETHELWDQDLSDHAKELGGMLEQFAQDDFDPSNLKL